MNNVLIFYESRPIQIIGVQLKERCLLWQRLISNGITISIQVTLAVANTTPIRYVQLHDLKSQYSCYTTKAKVHPPAVSPSMTVTLICLSAEQWTMMCHSHSLLACFWEWKTWKKGKEKAGEDRGKQRKRRMGKGREGKKKKRRKMEREEGNRRIRKSKGKMTETPKPPKIVIFAQF